MNIDGIGEETLENFVMANDTDIIARYGAHPADTDSAEYRNRRIALAMLVKADIFNDGDLELRQRWLSRVGAYGGQQ